MKELNTRVLEQVIKLMIRGEQDRAANLMEKFMAAKGAVIVNELNYASEDPMFPARRELQRELEDDIDMDRVDDEGALDGLDDGACEDEACPECGACPCECEGGEGLDSPEVVAKMIQDLIANGGLDQDVLSKIVDVIAGAEGGEGDGLDQDGEVPAEVPSSEEGLGDDELPPEGGETGGLSMDSENPEDAHFKG